MKYIYSILTKEELMKEYHSKGKKVLGVDVNTKGETTFKTIKDKDN